MKVHNSLIQNGESGIEFYPGYLPKLIRIFLVGERRSIWKETIKKLNPKIRHEIILKMQATKHADMLDDDFLVKELEDWLVDNPEYAFLVEY